MTYHECPECGCQCAALVEELDSLNRDVSAVAARAGVPAEPPDPHALWRAAGGGTPEYSRDAYIESMKRHGHLVPRPVEPDDLAAALDVDWWTARLGERNGSDRGMAEFVVATLRASRPAPEPWVCPEDRTEWHDPINCVHRPVPAEPGDLAAALAEYGRALYSTHRSHGYHVGPEHALCREYVVGECALSRPAPEPLDDRDIAICVGSRHRPDCPHLQERVEVRPNEDGTVDEVLIYVGGRCLFHMEQMNDDAYWFGIYPAGTDDRWSFWMSRKGKRLLLNEEERPALAPTEPSHQEAPE